MSKKWGGTFLGSPYDKELFGVIQGWPLHMAPLHFEDAQFALDCLRSCMTSKVGRDATADFEVGIMVGTLGSLCSICGV